MDTSGRKHPGKSAAVENNRDPEDGLERLLLSFVAKHALGDQCAGPSADESEYVQGAFLGSPSIIPCG
jgi:hypothetical protein